MSTIYFKTPSLTHTAVWPGPGNSSDLWELRASLVPACLSLLCVLNCPGMLECRHKACINSDLTTPYSCPLALLYLILCLLFPELGPSIWEAFEALKEAFGAKWFLEGVCPRSRKRSPPWIRLPITYIPVVWMQWDVIKRKGWHMWLRWIEDNPELYY